MPSSMIFAGLVVIWLLILLPAVARHRQEVARPSEAALAGRVLDRPRRPEPEVDDMNDTRTEGVTSGVPQARAAADDADDRSADDGGADETGSDDTGPDDGRRWDRPAPRYRPGRGGYDPHAAAAAARARSTFRQRVVLTLIVAALVTGVIAAAAITGVWWLHAAVDIALVGYLVHLRRQVRMEEVIRERRAARMAGTVRRGAADDPDLDDWARRGRIATSEPAQPAPAEEQVADEPPATDEPASGSDDLLREEPERVTGTGAPLPRIVTSLDELTVESALPRLDPAPPPPLPAGTVLVEELEDDPDLHGLDPVRGTDYRRAAGE